MRHFKPNEIIVLLGAGASVDAGISNSPMMIREVEKLIGNEWSRFKPLYNYVKGAIFYAESIDGRFGEQVPYNIEVLVNTLDELRKKEKHPLYPFVGAWNPQLVEVAGGGFKNVTDFRKEIVKKLQEWIALDRYDVADYFQGLMRFQQQYQFPLRVFTLNYDLCVERACMSASVERGFDSARIWDWRRFDDNPNDPKDLFLYKLHGSSDWKRDVNQKITYVDSPNRIPPDEVALIFGTTYKLQYVDPFLFFAYEFRRRTLDDARLIVSIGYGYGDEHINGILGQALNADPERRLLSVAPLLGRPTFEEVTRIANILGLKDQKQLAAEDCGAKEFMTQRMDVGRLADTLFPGGAEDLFKEVEVPSVT